jgi:hypothetical protein
MGPVCMTAAVAIAVSCATLAGGLAALLLKFAQSRSRKKSDEGLRPIPEMDRDERCAMGRSG